MLFINSVHSQSPIRLEPRRIRRCGADWYIKTSSTLVSVCLSISYAPFRSDQKVRLRPSGLHVGSACGAERHSCRDAGRVLDALHVALAPVCIRTRLGNALFVAFGCRGSSSRRRRRAARAFGSDASSPALSESCPEMFSDEAWLPATADQDRTTEECVRRRVIAAGWPPDS